MVYDYTPGEGLPSYPLSHLPVEPQAAVAPRPPSLHYSRVKLWMIIARRGPLPISRPRPLPPGASP